MHLTRMRYGGVPPFTEPVEFRFDEQVNLLVGTSATGKSRMLSANNERFNKSVMSQFAEYSLPIISLDNETPKEAVCTVFEKMKTGGVTLSMFELVTASFAAQDENLSLREDWDIRRNRLHGAFGALAALYVELGDQLAPAVAQVLRRRDGSGPEYSKRCMEALSRPNTAWISLK